MELSVGFREGMVIGKESKIENMEACVRIVRGYNLTGKYGARVDRTVPFE